jgi:hypothetical protein
MKCLLLAAALSVGVSGAALAQASGTGDSHGGAPSTASGPTATSNSTASGPTATSNRDDETDRAALVANQIVAEADARTAGIKADLHLTPDQDKNWTGFESSLHDIDKNRADRMVALQAERGQQKDSGDVIEYLNSHAKALDERSADVKKLADAGQPLYASLDEQQKRRFANELIHLSRERDTDW